MRVIHHGDNKMFSFAPAMHDPNSYKDHAANPAEEAFLALRWYLSRASMMLYYNSMHVTIENEKIRRASNNPLSVDAFFMLKRAVLHSLVLEVRALHDRKQRSLGSKQIAVGLKEERGVNRINDLLERNLPDMAIEDVEVRRLYLAYIQKYCEIMTADRDKCTPDGHPLSAKVELVRRMSNKDVAHSTIDRFELSGRDLGDVVIASTAIACAIQDVVGDSGIFNDLADVESMGYRAAGSLLNVEVDSNPYEVNAIRGFLPDWVRTGKEFPQFPEDFYRYRASKLAGKGAGDF